MAKSQHDSEMGNRTNNRVFGLDTFRTALVILSVSQLLCVLCVCDTHSTLCARCRYVSTSYCISTPHNNQKLLHTNT